MQNKFWRVIEVDYEYFYVKQSAGVVKVLQNWSEFFNHRAKRGGSLFEGSSGEEEGSRSDPPMLGDSPPFASFH